MQLVLTEDQELLAKTAADFVREHSPVSRMRQLRDAQRPDRLLAPALEADGGARLGRHRVPGGATAAPGMGLAELAVVLEAARPDARARAVPVDRAARRPGDRARRQRGAAGGLAAGDLRAARRSLALAHQEPQSRYDLLRVATQRASAKAAASVSTARRSRCSTRTAADALIVRARARPAAERDADGHHALPGAARRRRA